MLLFIILVTILGIALCWLLGREYYRGWKPLWFALLVVAAFILAWWILQVTQIDLWEYSRPFMPMLLGFILSSLLFYWAMRKHGSCHDECNCFCCCDGCSCHTGEKNAGHAGKTAAGAAAASMAGATGGSTKKKGGSGGAKDDLKRIEGIGPKIEELLHADGVLTFKDLANAGVARLQAVLDKAGKRFQIHDPQTWPLQAEYIVKGDLKGLKEYQDFLQGGKE